MKWHPHSLPLYISLYYNYQYIFLFYFIYSLILSIRKFVLISGTQLKVSHSSFSFLFFKKKIGSPLPSKTLEACKNASAILLGAVGGPKWPLPNNPARPEQGLLSLRKELNLYANIRPCNFVSQGLIHHSPLKEEIVKGVEFTVVRELTGGVYFGERQEEKDGIGKSFLKSLLIL